MKIKSIITTVIAIGVISVGSIYFMHAHIASASPQTKISNNLNSTNVPSIMPSSSVNNKTSSTTSSNNSEQINNSNGNYTDNIKNTNSDNQNKINNTSNSSVPQNHQEKSINPQTQNNKETSSNKVKNTGNFAKLLSATYISGPINGTTVIIPTSTGHIVNNQLIVPEYNTSNLNNSFTDKISALGNDKFIIDEYSNNTKTGVMNLTYHSANYSESLIGTFKNVLNGNISKVNLSLTTNNFAGQLQYSPFYKTVIGGTPVTIAVNSPMGLGSRYLEYYSGDSNAFSLAIDYDLSSVYHIGLLETYNGKKTGEYLLNPIDVNDTFTNSYKGVFISHPNTPQSRTYNVTLTGSNSPN